MKPFYFLGLLFTCSSLLAAEKGNGKSGDASFQKLMEGNRRYVSGEPINSGDLDEKRRELADVQAPFAIVVGCSDSRVPPEIIFDQSLGDLFVVRVAGNVVGPVEFDSIEYAAEVLHAPLIMVLGHEKCGAVDAVLQGKADENDLEGIVPFLKKAINQSKNLPGDPLTNAIKENVRETVRKLAANSDLKDLINKKKLKIFGCYYELESGKVTILK